MKSLVTGVFGGGTAVSNIFVDGETESDKIVGTVVQTEPGQTKLTKSTPYDTKLTVAGPTDLADMTGAVFATDGSGAPGPYSQTPYKLVTTDIESVNTDVTAIYRFIIANNVNPNESWLNAGNEIEAIYGQPPTGTSVNDAYQTFIFTDTKTSPSFTHTGNTPLRLNIYRSDDGTTWFPDVSGQINNGNRLQAEGSAQYWKMIRDDGNPMAPLNWYLDADPITVLTFPGDVGTNPDLQYFQAGDVVQGNPNYNSKLEWSKYVVDIVNQRQGAFGPTYLYNPIYNTHPSGMAGEAFTLTFPGGLKGVVSFGAHARENSTLEINGDGIERNLFTGDTNWARTADDVNPQNERYLFTLNKTTYTEIHSLRFNRPGANANCYYMKEDGVFLVDPSVDGVSVISTGYAQGSNTMVVDGGTWDTSNQSEVWSDPSNFTTSTGFL